VCVCMCACACVCVCVHACVCEDAIWRRSSSKLSCCATEKKDGCYIEMDAETK